jgi:hypothetical protein
MRATRKKGTSLTAIDREAPPSVEDILELVPELQPTYEELRELFGGLARHCALEDYRVGQIVVGVWEKIRALRSDIGGERALGFLALMLEIHPRVLYTCRKIAGMYSPEEFEELVSRQPITWPHVVSLSTVADPVRRKELADRTVQEQWTSDELARQISGEKRALPPKPARRPGVPRNFRQGLSRVLKGSQAYENYLEQAWFSEAFDLAAEIPQVPPDQWTPEIREEVARGAAFLERIGKRASQNAARLAQGLQWIDTDLAHTERQKQEAERQKQEAEKAAAKLGVRTAPGARGGLWA